MPQYDFSKPVTIIVYWWWGSYPALANGREEIVWIITGYVCIWWGDRFVYRVCKTQNSVVCHMRQVSVYVKMLVVTVTWFAISYNVIYTVAIKVREGKIRFLYCLEHSWHILERQRVWGIINRRKVRPTESGNRQRLVLAVLFSYAYQARELECRAVACGVVVERVFAVCCGAGLACYGLKTPGHATLLAIKPYGDSITARLIHELYHIGERVGLVCVVSISYLVGIYTKVIAAWIQIAVGDVVVGGLLGSANIPWVYPLTVAHSIAKAWVSAMAVFVCHAVRTLYFKPDGIGRGCAVAVNGNCRKWVRLRVIYRTILPSGSRWQYQTYTIQI